METYNIVDKAALAASGALILLGVVVLGFVEILDGPPYGAAPTTNEAGEVIATPIVDPNVRTGLVVAGLVVLLAWGVYRMASTRTADADTHQPGVTAD